MQTTKLMREVIEGLADKAGIALSQMESYAKLELEGYMPLVIETPYPHQVAVAHFYVQMGDVCYDPEVVFFTGLGSVGWVPMSFTQHNLGIYREVAWCDDPNAPGRLTRHKPAAVADLVSFSNTWARNLRAQGWLDRARVTAKETPDVE